MDSNMLMKGLMGAALGVTFVTMLFFAPRGWALTSSASNERVERKPGASSAHGARGPRYVFIGGYFGGK